MRKTMIQILALLMLGSAAQAGTIEIVVLMTCDNSGSCTSGTGRQMIFQTAEACERFADTVNRHNVESSKFETWRCFKQTVPVWEPTRQR